MIKGIKFASIPVRDQDASLEFYTKTLGFKVITDAPFDGTQRWIELGLPRAETKLVLFTAQGQALGHRERHQGDHERRHVPR